MTWLTDNRRPIAVTAVTQRFQPEVYRGVDDEATILVEYPSAQGIIQASWNWPFDRKDLEVCGSTGQIIAMRGDGIRVRLPGPQEEPGTAPPLAAPENDFLSYLAAVTRKEITPSGLSSLENRLIVTEILDAARRSATTGQRVVLKQGPGGRTSPCGAPDRGRRLHARTPLVPSPPSGAILSAMTSQPEELRNAWSRHDRTWKANVYVYPVVSRRSGGISIGINLNPDKACNFDCVYCQVDRTTPPTVRRVDLAALPGELDLVIAAEKDGSLYSAAPFSALPAGARGVRDFAFSGDGEPTASPGLAEAVGIVAEARRRHGLPAAKLVLITDAAYLQKPSVVAALALMDQNNGEIWAKLDAGTEEYFRAVDRPNVTLATVLENIIAAARVRPLVIQSLWMKLSGEAPPRQEVDAFCDRLSEILQEGGRLRAVQIYTVARHAAETFVAPLTDAELDCVAEVVTRRIPVPVETYYGTGSE